MSIIENLERIKNALPPTVTVVTVSKTKPASSILEAYDAGQRVFGENKVQELSMKFEALPKDIEWHMIGHLQSNKVKYIAPFVHLIHAVDKLKLLVEINKRANNENRTINCLLQIHIAKEENKFGFSTSELTDLLNQGVLKTLPNVRITGLMGMATNTNDESQIRNEFSSLHQFFLQLKSSYFQEDNSFTTLSMGMSGDYAIAVEEGSNMVRIGSAIFGPRN